MKDNLIKDSLYYLSADCDCDPVLARGVVTGLVSGLMAQGWSFEKTIAYLRNLARPDVRIECLPECWRAEWLK